MASVRRQALKQAVSQVAGAAGAPTGFSIATNRARPHDDDDLPFARAYEAPEQPGPGDHGTGEPVVERVFRFRIEMTVKATRTDEDPGDLLDAVYVHVVKAIMADPTLGGLVQEVEEGPTVFDLEERAWPYMNAATEFVATLYTPRDDPEDNANA